MALNQLTGYEKFLPGIIDKVYEKESIFGKLFTNPDVKIAFDGIRTAKIVSLATTGLTNYRRGGYGEENKVGAVQTKVETFELDMERFSSIPLDKLDTLDDAETVLGHLTKEFIRTKVVPETDAYTISKVVAHTSKSLGNRREAVIDENNALQEIWRAFTYLAQRKVPENNQVIIMNPETYSVFVNSEKLTKFITVGNFNGSVNYQVQKFQGRDIIVAPDDRMFTGFEADDLGFHPTANSKKVNFVVCDKSAVNFIKRLDWTKVYTSDQVKLPFVGYLAENLMYYGAFVPTNKAVGIYACISTDAALGNELLVDIAPSTADHAVLNAVLTSSAYDHLYLTNAAKEVGTDIAVGAGVVEITIGTPFEPNDANNWVVAAINGKVSQITRDLGTIEVGE